MSTTTQKPTAPVAPAGKSAAQLLEEQLKRFRALTERRTKMEAKLMAGAQQHAEAQAESEKEFGTGDVGQLRTLFSDREQDNYARVAKFTSELDSLENALNETEAKLVD